MLANTLLVLGVFLLAEQREEALRPVRHDPVRRQAVKVHLVDGTTSSFPLLALP
jgi:hypothetical protein